VEAFRKVDKGLTRTIANYVAKNAVIYETFEAKQLKMRKNLVAGRDNANIVKQRSDELFNYMQDLKIERFKGQKVWKPLLCAGKLLSLIRS